MMEDRQNEAKNRNLLRFVHAQDSGGIYDGTGTYAQALQEVKAGHKRGHWIWYVFPQMKGLGFSDMAEFYGIADRDEGENYLLHPTLNDRIHEISTALLEHQDKSAEEIFGGLDAMKVRSSMTLFDELSPNDGFAKVLDAFYHGERDTFARQ